MIKKSILLENLKKEVETNNNSPLFNFRIRNNYKVVIGEGNLDSKIIFVGEAPGRKEAETGRPFVGAAGRILDEMINSIGCKRSEVYITSLLLDRPPDNRNPNLAEINFYSLFLIRQIEIIKPEIIVTLGKFSMEFLMNYFGLGNEIQSISKVHGKFFEIDSKNLPRYIVTMFHPAYALYQQKSKQIMFTDFKILKNLVNKSNL